MKILAMIPLLVGCASDVKMDQLSGNSCFLDCGLCVNLKTSCVDLPLPSSVEIKRDLKAPNLEIDFK